MKYAVADISSSSLSVIIAEICGTEIEVTGKEREIDIVYKVDIASVLQHKLKQ